MNNENQVLEMVSGHMAVEGKVSGVELLKAMQVEGFEAPETAKAVRTLVSQGVIKMDQPSITKSTITFIPEGERTVIITPVKETASPTVKASTPFGVTECVNWKGEKYLYKRSAFDGPEGQLDEEHELMKKDFMRFKHHLRNVVPTCNGVGKDAITMFEPDSPYANKDGKVFYRWDNGNGYTAKKMDELYPLMMAEARRVAEELLNDFGEGE